MSHKTLNHKSLFYGSVFMESIRYKLTFGQERLKSKLKEALNNLTRRRIVEPSWGRPNASGAFSWISSVFLINFRRGGLIQASVVIID